VTKTITDPSDSLSRVCVEDDIASQLRGATAVLSVSCLTPWLPPLLSKTITGGPFALAARRSRRKGRACFAVAPACFAAKHGCARAVKIKIDGAVGAPVNNLLGNGVGIVSGFFANGGRGKWRSSYADRMPAWTAKDFAEHLISSCRGLDLRLRRRRRSVAVTTKCRRTLWLLSAT
jgi:hypothetical protein